jgi:hypothetical protein
LCCASEKVELEIKIEFDACLIVSALTMTMMKGRVALRWAVDVVI